MSLNMTSLLANFESYVIKGNAIHWFNSYLIGTSQFAKTRVLRLRHLPFEVPQGDGLGCNFVQYPH